MARCGFSGPPVVRAAGSDCHCVSYWQGVSSGTLSHSTAMLAPMTESLRDRRKRRTAEAIVTAALELFAERGFERTTVEQIAAAADISRRTFFRYFADKEELFFAEDERLLEVIGETLDGAPAGEPVLELARRATRALAARSTADPRRRLDRERLIAATPALQARRLAKNLRWVRDPGRDLPGLVDESFAALGGIAG